MDVVRYIKSCKIVTSLNNFLESIRSYIRTIEDSNRVHISAPSSVKDLRTTCQYQGVKKDIVCRYELILSVGTDEAYAKELLERAKKKKWSARLRAVM